ncbi:hypothetical protein MATL_G00222300 [Megalops atlanticus]|uniref:Ameloblastin n=1 Tax=Megalops atlanticus TaxID=7932 RepID=A0A9D3T2Z8_MEGAT|nr:hypothetical protein MATL_G00222300 [Megalops atlanticus]
MRAAFIFSCLLATVCTAPVRTPAMRHIIRQIQAQQRPQPAASVSQEAMQDLARVKNMLEQYARMFPPLNVPAVQPQNPMLQIPPLVLPSGTPLETPPQDPLAAAKPPQVEPSQAEPPQVEPPQVAPDVVLKGDLPVQGDMTQAPEPGTQVLQPAAPTEQGPQAVPPVIVPLQPNPWAPQPGLQVLTPFQPNFPGVTPTDQPTPTGQLPQVFPSYGYFPFFPAQTGNQQFPAHGFPLFFPAAFPQPPAQPADTAQTTQPVQPVQPAQPGQPGQQQIPQIFYMMRQTMAGPFGSASSEELQGAGPMGGFGMFLPGFGGGLPTAGVGPVLPGGLPAGQGQGLDPALSGAPPTSPLAPTALPAGLENADTAAGPGDQSNRPVLGLTTPSASSRVAPPTVTAPQVFPDPTPSTGGTDTDLYP